MPSTPSADSSFSLGKKPILHKPQYPTREKAIRDVTRYIELRYNQQRLHSGLDYRTPNEAEQAWITENLAA
ncbi:IS3 family transposase [Rathayibacter tritici]|uniref:IS3 family transposase n=1 Tax=Rathayibacter tritici TaxID=33888 RepID=UPI00358F1975